MASLGGFFFIKLKCLLKVLNFNRLFLKLNRSICNLLRPTSHTSQEPWPRNCKSPKESVQRPSHYTSKIMWCGHGPSSVVWSHTWPVPSTECYFNEFLFMRVLTYGTIEKKINSCEHLECHGLPVVLSEAHLQKMVFEKSPNDHETWSIRCHVGIHVDTTSIFHSRTYSVGPSSIVWSELGPVSPPFPPMRVLEV